MPSVECRHVTHYAGYRVFRNRAPDCACADGLRLRGRLAAAVTAAGGLGLIGGGYGDANWLESQIGQADGARIGYGFITWSLDRNPDLLDVVLAEQPATVMLSFGELQPFADRIRAAGVPLMAQVQALEQVRQALDAGADIVAAQGGEAGGHGMSVRSTFTLVPEVVDLVASGHRKRRCWLPTVSSMAVG